LYTDFQTTVLNGFFLSMANGRKSHKSNIPANQRSKKPTNPFYINILKITEQ